MGQWVSFVECTEGGAWFVGRIVVLAPSNCFVALFVFYDDVAVGDVVAAQVLYFLICHVLCFLVSASLTVSRGGDWL